MTGSIKEFIASPVLARYAQGTLIVSYAALAALFTLHKKTWPVALYYAGCFVKDTSVFALAFLMKWFN